MIDSWMSLLRLLRSKFNFFLDKYFFFLEGILGVKKEKALCFVVIIISK